MLTIRGINQRIKIKITDIAFRICKLQYHLAGQFDQELTGRRFSNETPSLKCSVGRPFGQVAIADNGWMRKTIVRVLFAP